MLRRLLLGAALAAVVAPAGAASAAILQPCSGSGYEHGFQVANPTGGDNFRFCIIN